ncbi:hypothetical protein CSUI_008945 [Cystoisospora suis]|uniref:Uncharacterized protein n=1 Tax=Cystoisospora suis TaxID=483139 RepID=A0A2C6KLD0_9APIC|nr:hypothetical protein CSUI_008945 [Cystoisospora suis]
MGVTRKTAAQVAHSRGLHFSVAGIDREWPVGAGAWVLKPECYRVTDFTGSCKPKSQTLHSVKPGTRFRWTATRAQVSTTSHRPWGKRLRMIQDAARPASRGAMHSRRLDPLTGQTASPRGLPSGSGNHLVYRGA